MKHLNHSTCLFLLPALCLCVLSVSTGASAQRYSKVSGGSKFYCAQLPNGSTKIVTKVGKSFDVVSFSSASKTAVKNRNALQKRLIAINQLIESVINSNYNFDREQLADYVKVFLAASKGKKVKVPKTNADRLARLQALSLKVQVQASNAQAEVDGIARCKENKVTHDPLTFESQVVHVEDQGFDYVVLLLLAPDFGGSSANYCVRQTTAAIGSSNLQEFSRRPCLHINCPSTIVPSGELGDIVFTADLGFQASDDSVAQAINSISAMAAMGYTGIISSDCSQF